MPVIERVEADPEISTYFKDLRTGDIFILNGDRSTYYMCICSVGGERDAIELSSGQGFAISEQKPVHPLIRGESLKITQR